mmetsp:Transcript_6104/g.14615  ORF Transcript_6104/g.14615 Transcript_6104/m.14615 type:complete len:224 (-) Transcript_6104:1216-1887(-)
MQIDREPILAFVLHRLAKHTLGCHRLGIINCWALATLNRLALLHILKLRVGSGLHNESNLTIRLAIGRMTLHASVSQSLRESDSVLIHWLEGADHGVGYSRWRTNLQRLARMFVRFGELTISLTTPGEGSLHTSGGPVGGVPRSTGVHNLAAVTDLVRIVIGEHDWLRIPARNPVATLRLGKRSVGQTSNTVPLGLLPRCRIDGMALLAGVLHGLVESYGGRG